MSINTTVCAKLPRLTWSIPKYYECWWRVQCDVKDTRWGWSSWARRRRRRWRALGRECCCRRWRRWWPRSRRPHSSSTGSYTNRGKKTQCQSLSWSYEKIQQESTDFYFVTQEVQNLERLLNFYPRRLSSLDKMMITRGCLVYNLNPKLIKCWCSRLYSMSTFFSLNVTLHQTVFQLREDSRAQCFASSLLRQFTGQKCVIWWALSLSCVNS